MRASQRPIRNAVAARRWVAALTLSATLGLLPAPASGQVRSDESEATTFFFGFGAGLCTLVYTPLKVVYAAAALPLSGLVYMWSVGDTEMAGRVMRSGTQGTFVLTPQHLRGEAELDFVGAANEGPPEDEKKQ